MKIAIHPKAKKVLIIIAAVAIIAIATLAILPLLHKDSAAPAVGISPDAQAAVDAATAFYTLDYTVDSDLWATRVCAHTTDAGCRAIRIFFAPAVSTMVLENHVQTTCTVVPIRLISEKGNIRIWQVSVTLLNPWPELENSAQDAYVEVEKINGIWLMNRILFQQEVDQLIAPAP